MEKKIKTRKMDKPSLVKYLENHGSSMVEAANIAGTNPRTLGRWLEKGMLPTEWYEKIREALKDRKPEKKKPVFFQCACCGAKIPEDAQHKYFVTKDILKTLGVEEPPKNGYKIATEYDGSKTRMWRICPVCFRKHEMELAKKRSAKKKTVKKSK